MAFARHPIEQYGLAVCILATSATELAKQRHPVGNRMQDGWRFWPSGCQNPALPPNQLRSGETSLTAPLIRLT